MAENYVIYNLEHAKKLFYLVRDEKNNITPQDRIVELAVIFRYILKDITNEKISVYVKSTIIDIRDPLTIVTVECQNIDSVIIELLKTYFKYLISRHTGEFDKFCEPSLHIPVGAANVLFGILEELECTIELSIIIKIVGKPNASDYFHSPKYSINYQRLYRGMLRTNISLKKFTIHNLKNAGSVLSLNAIASFLSKCTIMNKYDISAQREHAIFRAIAANDDIYESLIAYSHVPDAVKAIIAISRT